MWQIWGILCNWEKYAFPLLLNTINITYIIIISKHKYTDCIDSRIDRYYALISLSLYSKAVESLNLKCLHREEQLASLVITQNWKISDMEDAYKQQNPLCSS